DLRAIEDHELDGPTIDAREHRRYCRNRDNHALQSVAFRGTHGRSSPRLYLWSGAQGTRRSVCANDAQRNEFRLLIAFLSGKDRTTACADVYSRDPLRVLVTSRDVRELAITVGRSARFTTRRTRCAL